MTRSLLNGSDEVAPSTDPSEDATDLEVAEAEVAAAEAEAAAARARANAALARARVARTQRGEVKAPTDREPDSVQPRSDTDNATGPETAIDDAADAAEIAEKRAVAGAAVAGDAADPPPSAAGSTAVADSGRAASDAVAEHDSTDRPSRIRRLAKATRLRKPSLRRPTKRGIAVTVMSVITVAALVTTALIGWHHHTATSEHERAQAFTAAADRGVTAITSLDFNNAQRDVQRILDQSTGAFYNDFKGRAKDFTSVIEQSKVTTKGKVTGSAVESMNGDDAVILVSAGSDVTNAAGAKQEPRTWRLRVTVSDVDGTMKISKVDFVP
ncbi:hypothetical protein [Gordonia sp. SL306]|uniref:hypothetical protein n=1 Tax=Gordonia sp. SL306 TaxID=2995145 RepID=UPI00226DF958|nr:hypothetical protein [Gordonia sp. SL306]WAC54061.1 hypothetical protein OVA31_15335 [Gordonia sp. SL306]